MQKHKPFAQVLWESRFSSYPQRLEAIDLIRSLKGIEAIVWLTEAFEDEEKFVKHRAYNILRRIMYKSTLEELLNYIGNPDPAVRELATYGLRAFEGKAKQEALLNCISDPNDYVAQAAITVIGESSTPPRTGLRKLITSVNPKVRFRAATALDEINREDKTPWVQLPEKYPGPRRCSRLKSPPTQTFDQIVMELENSKLTVRLAAIDQLGHFRNTSVFDVLYKLASDPECRLRAHTAKALGLVNDPRAVEVLNGMSSDPVRRVKYAAVKALGNQGDLALSCLLDVLHRGDADLQALALNSLAKLKPSDQWRLVFQKLGAAQKHLRFKAAQVLRFWSLPEVVDALIEVLKDETHPGRVEAAYALGRTGAPSAADPLCLALKDSNPVLRRQATESLGMLRRLRARPALEALLSDEDWRVAHVAKKALLKLDKQKRLW